MSEKNAGPSITLLYSCSAEHDFPIKSPIPHTHHSHTTEKNHSLISFMSTLLNHDSHCRDITNAGLMVAHRLRRSVNIKPTFVQLVTFAGTVNGCL